MMNSRILGSSGLEVSVFGLGSMTFGAESDVETSHAILDRYYEAGGRFVDTADVYSRGVSEQIIGDWLEARSHTDVTVATKARFAMGDGPDDSGAGRAHLIKAVDQSLHRLGVDTIDLYQMHAWDPAVPLEETLATLNDFVAAGKIRAVGVSNYLGWHLERAIQLSRQNGWTAPVSLQPQYNLLDRQIELDSMPVALEHEIRLLPWSPLGGGWLTGKYRRDHRPTGATRLGEDPGRGVEAYDLRNTDRTWRILDVVMEVAEGRDVSPAEVALNWLRARPGVASVLIGCRTVDQLESNLRATDWELTEDEMSRLNEASAPGVPDYPYGFLERYAGVQTWTELQTQETELQTWAR